MDFSPLNPKNEKKTKKKEEKKRLQVNYLVRLKFDKFP